MEEALHAHLKRMENFKELFQLLDERGMQEEKGRVAALMDYMDGMEQQLGRVLRELQAVKRQMVKIEQGGQRQNVQRTVGILEAKIKAAKAELADFKNQLLDGVNRTIAGCRDKGTLAIYKTVDFLGIQKGLAGLKKHLHQAMEAADSGIDSLGNIRKEMDGVKTHLKNIKKELTGKAPLAENSRETEKGAVFQVQKVLYETMRALERMEKHTDNVISKLDSLEEKARKSSVVKRLKTFQNRIQKEGGERIHRKTREAVR